jgi:hypothetical protein
MITVIEVTYINTEQGKPAEFIGLWFREGDKCKLQLFGLERTDLLSLREGDKGTLRRNGEVWDFVPLGH